MQAGRRASQMVARPVALVLMATLASAGLVGCSDRQRPVTPATTAPTGPSQHTSLPGPSAPSPPTVRAVLLARLDQPLAMATRSGDEALYIATKTGTVRAVRDGRVERAPVLDLSGLVSHGAEQGLLGLAFSPDGRFLYVNYTDRRGDTNVVEYAWGNGRVEISTRRRVLFVRQPFANHNGGNLVFGPDGHLYIGLGDGGTGSEADPYRHGQDLGVLLGKILRVDPRPRGGRPYGIPPDNPFSHRPGARPEIWAYGLRNPWRFTFDRQTGDLWIGDPGTSVWEEVDFQPAGSPGGLNYGWSSLEGTHARVNNPPQNAVPPVDEYGHASGGCSIVGGYAYRGSALASLKGWYVFGDYCSGDISALRSSAGQVVEEALGARVEQLSSFGEDQGGELYALSLAGGLFKLAP